jgi:glycosyltransferase involved in cell wall biosynthesis
MTSSSLSLSWSVMIPTHNCADFLEHTLTSVLRADYDERLLHIEVVDDCSTRDDPEAVVGRLGRGRVRFFRQPANVGVTANFNTCVERASGDIVHILHGDDLVDPSYYQRVTACFARWPRIAGVFTRCDIIDVEGNFTELSPSLGPMGETPTTDPSPLYYSNPIRTPGAAVRRAFYQQHGVFATGLPHTGDWDMWIRVVTEGGAVAVNEPLALYRMHSANQTALFQRDSADLHEELVLGESISRKELPGFDFERFRRVVRANAGARAAAALAAGDRAAYRAHRRAGRQSMTPMERVHDVLGSLTGGRRRG